MTETTGKERHPLVASLEGLAKDADRDRATLAMLRTSLRPGRELDALPFVLSRFPARNEREENDAILLSGLFALHPESGAMSLAAALREVRDITGSDSVELRFRALLGASRDELPSHLRHAVGLVAGHKLGIDWENLFWTIRGWNREDQRSRRRWARDFWAEQSSPSQGKD